MLSAFHTGVNFMSNKASFSGKEVIDALTLIALIKARPCVKKTGDRMTLVGYAELTTLEKWLRAIAIGPASTLSHGSNSDCPEVQTGEWKHCHGHTEFNANLTLNDLKREVIQEFLTDCREFESTIGMYFTLEGFLVRYKEKYHLRYAEWLLTQLEDTGDVLCVKYGREQSRLRNAPDTRLWHVLV